MLEFLPKIAALVSVPRLAWRGDTGAPTHEAKTAADVIRHEQRQGRLSDLSPAFVAFLEGIAAAALLWVTFKRAQAARYGPPLRVEIDRRAYAIGEDGEGGYLLLFLDDETDDVTRPQMDMPTMKTPAEATPRELDEAARLYLAERDAPAPANQNHGVKAMPTNDTKPDRLRDLAADRQADLEKRIDYLQAEANGIGSAYEREQTADRRALFDEQQAELAATGATVEKEAHGHDYAGFLALQIGDHHEANNRPDLADPLFKEAEARKDIAGMLREGERFQVMDPDTMSPTGPALDAKGALSAYADLHGYKVFEAPDSDPKVWVGVDGGALSSSGNSHSEIANRLVEIDHLARATGQEITPEPQGGKYDALRQTEAQPLPVTTPTPSPEIEDEDKKRQSAAPYGDEPTRPVHLRATLAAEPAPDGTKSTRSTYLDPNENPDLKEFKAAVAEPRPLHPDDHTPPKDAAEPPPRDPTPAERMAADIQALTAEPEGRAEAAQEVTQRLQADESSKRQEGERRANAGEAPQEGQEPTRPQTPAERMAADMKELSSQPERSEGRDVEQSPNPSGRGMF